MNPVFERELRSAVRNGRFFIVAGLYALALGGLAIQLWPSQSQALYGSRIGERIFEQFRQLQLALALGLAPALTWSAISAERERGTWSTLRATPLEPRRIVLGKLGCALAQLLMLIAASLPVTCYCFFLGGVSPAKVRSAYVTAMCAGVAASSVGLMCSALMRRTPLAIVTSYVIIGALAAAMWPLNVCWQTLLLAAFCLSVATRSAGDPGAIEPAEPTSSRPFERSRGEPEGAPLDHAGNLVAAWDLARARPTRRTLATIMCIATAAQPIALLQQLYLCGLPWTRTFFPWHAAAQVELVMVAAAAAGGFAIAVERERRTLPLLLSTPLSAATILRGKLFVVLWHAALLTLASVPHLVCSAFAQVIAFSEVFVLVGAQISLGVACGIIGLLFSLRARQTNRALGWTLAFLLVTATLSLQLLPLAPLMNRSRLGQVVLATNPAHAVWEREQPLPWETAFEEQREAREIATARTMPPRNSLARRIATRSQPDSHGDTGALDTLDDLPWLSVLGVSVAMYLGLAAVLWRLMHARFRAWSASS